MFFLSVCLTHFFKIYILHKENELGAWEPQPEEGNLIELRKRHFVVGFCLFTEIVGNRKILDAFILVFKPIIQHLFDVRPEQKPFLFLLNFWGDYVTEFSRCPVIEMFPLALSVR